MMPDVSFSGLVIVVAVGFLVPLLLGLAPRLRLPAVVQILNGALWRMTRYNAACRAVAVCWSRC